MAELSTTTTGAIATATGSLGMAVLLPSIDGNALVGAFAGASLFVISARELPLWRRISYLIISLIMGYLAAPEIIANTFIEQSGVAGFIAGLLCVSCGLLLIENFKGVDLLALIRGGKK